MKILSIGNSFSQDAQRYLHALAENAGIPLFSVNLMIGGCSLARHFRNSLSGLPAYSLEVNGAATGFSVSLEEALLSNDWDFVTLQQLSSWAPDYRTYQPYLDRLSDMVSELVPGAKRIFNQTWAYEAGSQRLTKELGYQTPKEMTERIREAVALAKSAINADGVLPFGDAMLALSEKTETKIHRDTFHASLGAGRLLLSEVMLTALSGRDIRAVPAPKTDAPISPEDLALLRQVAYDAVAAAGWKIGE